MHFTPLARRIIRIEFNSVVFPTPGPPVMTTTRFPTNGWIRTSTWTVLPEPVWDAVEAGGDVSWTISDSSSPRWALLARRQDIATLVHFHASPDRQGVTPLNTKLGKDMNGNVSPLPTNIGPNGPLTIQFIQSPKTAGRFPGLDAVMAVDLPLTQPWDGNTNPILLPNTPLGQSSNGQPVLIRNRKFDQNADINNSHGQGWQVEIPSFPPNAMGFFVAGSRAAAIYYTFTFDGKDGKLFRWSGASWGNAILTGLAFDAATNGVYGPAFVNPYDQNVLYAIALNAIMVSTNGGNSFAAENALTALVTASGKLPTTSLMHMAFHYENPDEVVAGAANGVFYSAGGDKWTDLTRFVPKPLVPTAAVGIDSEFVYVAANGRSPIGIRGYKNV